MMRVFISGGAGFIATNFIIFLLRNSQATIMSIDRDFPIMLDSEIAKAKEENRFEFFKCNIGDKVFLGSLLEKFQPTLIVNFAADTHVDASIKNPIGFVENNVLRYSFFLETIVNHWTMMKASDEQDTFLILNISTDEVYGSLDKLAKPFNENNQILPNSPYSASKAAADHLSRAFHETYGLPVSTIRCSNNYGPFQSPDKLIPLMIARGFSNDKMPVYGEGLQRRDWIHVEDHCEAIFQVGKNSGPGEIYNVGTGNDIANNEVVEGIISMFNSKLPMEGEKNYKSLLHYVTERPGHDFRYSIDYSKVKNNFGWHPKISFTRGLEKTFNWYSKNREWLALAAKKLE